LLITLVPSLRLPRHSRSAAHENKVEKAVPFSSP
jgi:hypothetical protein